MAMSWKEELDHDRIFESISEGDCVYLKGPACLAPVVEDLAIETLKRRALPYFTLHSFTFRERIVEEALDADCLRTIPAPLRAFYENTDHFIFVEPMDASRRASSSRQKCLARKEREEQLKKIARKKGLTEVFPTGREALKDPEFVLNPPIPVSRLKACADLFVKRMALNIGNFLAIKGCLCSLRFLEEISLAGYRKGVHSLIQSASDDYKIRFLSDSGINSETIGITIRNEARMMKRIDGRILIYEHEDPKCLDSVKHKLRTQKRIAKLLKSRSEWLDIIRQKKYIYSAFPTKMAAKRFNVPFGELCKAIIDGILSMRRVFFSSVSALSRSFSNVIISQNVDAVSHRGSGA